MKFRFLIYLLILSSFLSVAFVQADADGPEDNQPTIVPMGGLKNYGMTKDDYDPAIAFSDRSKTFLLVQEYLGTGGDTHIVAQFIDLVTGDRIGDAFFVASTSNAEANPDVVYDSINDRFFVVWDVFSCTGTIPNYCGYVIKGRLVYDEHKNTDQFPAGAFTVASQVSGMATIYDLKEPAVGYNPDDQQYLVVFRRNAIANTTTYRSIYGQMLSASDTTSTRLGPFQGFSLRSYSSYTVSAPDIAGSHYNENFLVTWTVYRPSDVNYVGIGYVHDTYKGNNGQDQLIGSWKMAPLDRGSRPLTSDCVTPKVAYHAGAGDYVVVFKHVGSTAATANSPQADTSEIYGQVVDGAYRSDGFAIDGAYAFRVEDGSDAKHFDPDIVYSEGGNYMHIVYWSDPVEAAPIPYTYVYQRSMQVPGKVGAEVELRESEENKEITRPTLSCGFKSPGHWFCVAVWQEEYSGDGYDDWDIMGKRFNQSCYSLDVQLEPACPGCSIGKSNFVEACPSPDYEAGTEITISATPGSNYSFSHWSGDATGSANPIKVTMDGNKAITAHFVIDSHTLTVSTEGNGMVISTPHGISCGSRCTASYIHNTEVTLRPFADPGSDFSHWTGACTGSGDCSVTMTRNRNVTANFVVAGGTDNHVHLPFLSQP